MEQLERQQRKADKKAKRSSKVEEASSQAKAKAETEPGERTKVAEVK